MLLEITSLSKSFKQKSILNDISFSIHEGEIGLIGPNGSGKTTLLNILMGMVRPTSGSFQLQSNSTVGMSVSRKGFFDDMTVNNNLLHHACLLGASEESVNKILIEFSIDYIHQRFNTLSAGMKQRVSLVLPFIRKNTLVFLDEPTNHLDIDSILLLRQTILREKKNNKASFLITSHILSDLEKVCDRILFLKDGVIVKNSLTHLLLEEYGNLEEAYIEILQAPKK